MNKKINLKEFFVHFSPEYFLLTDTAELSLIKLVT
jgi:hypothetical protein